MVFSLTPVPQFGTAWFMERTQVIVSRAQGSIRQIMKRRCDVESRQDAIHVMEENRIYIEGFAMSIYDDQERCCQRRGRPRVPRIVGSDTLPPTATRRSAPLMNRGRPYPSSLEEVAVLKLVDLQGLEQEEAGAAALGVSRKTLWRDLHEARRKGTDALVNGKAIEVAGCKLRSEGLCPKHQGGICPRQEDQMGEGQ
jgi:uncharacterized protein